MASQQDANTSQQQSRKDGEREEYKRSYLRAANEDDDGYDPYSDRPAAREPLFERDPWN